MQLVRHYPSGCLVIGLDVQADRLAASVQRVRSAKSLLAEESDKTIGAFWRHGKGEPAQPDMPEPDAQATIDEAGDDEL